VPAPETGSAVVVSLAIEPEAPATKGTALAVRFNLLMSTVPCFGTPVRSYLNGMNRDGTRGHVRRLRKTQLASP
jgi:hypothetical protein